MRCDIEHLFLIILTKNGFSKYPNEGFKPVSFEFVIVSQQIEIQVWVHSSHN